MNTYETLINKAFADGIDVVDYKFNSDNIKGLYCDGTIALNKNLKTTIQKTCILSEELGHHYTSMGNVLNTEDLQNGKQ